MEATLSALISNRASTGADEVLVTLHIRGACSSKFGDFVAASNHTEADELESIHSVIISDSGYRQTPPPTSIDTLVLRFRDSAFDM